jgi:cardiolipin synthase
MLKYLPNFLTLLRIILIPILVSAFFLEGVVSNRIATLLFVIAAITDYFDGYFARLLQAQSNLGKIFDPIADKLLVITVIIMLIHFGNGDVYITIPGIIILFREVFVSGLREFLAELNVSLPVSRLAKWKTAVQMIALSLMVLGDKGANISYVDEIGRFGLMLAAILTVVTGFAYFRAAARYFKN